MQIFTKEGSKFIFNKEALMKTSMLECSFETEEEANEFQKQLTEFYTNEMQYTQTENASKFRIK